MTSLEGERKPLLLQQLSSTGDAAYPGKKEGYRRFVIPLIAVAGLGILAAIYRQSMSVRFPEPEKGVSVAFLGNSMMYYNDLPRLMEVLSGNRITQNSCLHGDATVPSLLVSGSGLLHIYNTSNALLSDDENGEIYDFGACSVRQLLFGNDSNLMTEIENGDYGDGKNPCLVEPDVYLPYIESFFEENPPQWDFVMINDNTRNPGRNNTRQAGLAALKATYLPWFKELGATPVFMCTHAYFTPERDLTGLDDIPTFTSLTYEGYKEYAELLREHLPKSQKPRIAPNCIAFLTVWEEDRDLWHKMFHQDHVHASPVGTFLQGAVVHYTLLHDMPNRKLAFPKDMSSLWDNARRLQPPDCPPNPFPTREEAEYLFDVADRVVRQGYRPPSFITYHNGEASDYVETARPTSVFIETPPPSVSPM